MSFTASTALQIHQLLRYLCLLLISVSLPFLDYETASITQFENFIFYSGLLSFFWISASINAFLARHDDTNFLKELPSVLGGNIGIASLLSVGFIAFNAVSQQFAWPFVIATCVYIIGNGAGYLLEYILLLQKKQKALLSYSIAYNVSALIGAGVAILYFQSIYLLIGVLSTIALFRGIHVLMLSLAQKSLFQKGTLQAHWVFALPLGLSLLLGGAPEYLDGFIIKYFGTDSDFILYRYGAKELPLTLLLANAFASSMLPLIRNNWMEARTKILSYSKKFLLWFTPLCMALIAVSPWVFENILGTDFASSAIVFSLFIMLMVPRAFFPQTVIIGKGHPNVIPMITAIELSFNFGLSLLFWQLWGIAGVAAASVIAYAIEKVLLESYCRLQLQTRSTDRSLILMSLLSISLLFSVFYMTFV